MKYASEDLRNEHDGILVGLEILDTMTAELDSGNMIERNDLTGMIDFLKLFADKCHHGKEEGILFPAMEKAGVRKEGGPIAQMLSEHQQGRSYIAEMGASLDGNSFDSGRFARAAAGYSALLRAHIAKENTVLFPLADKTIPADIQIELAEAFERHEETVMGPGVHERLHGMLDRFTGKYLERNGYLE